MNEAKIEYKMTCSMTPNQFEGTIDGKHFYFRARHNGWSFTVDDNPDNPDNVVMGCAPYYHDSGNEEGAGWWDEDEAEEFLKTCINRYFAGEYAPEKEYVDPYAKPFTKPKNRIEVTTFIGEKEYGLGIAIEDDDTPGQLTAKIQSLMTSVNRTITANTKNGENNDI